MNANLAVASGMAAGHAMLATRDVSDNPSAFGAADAIRCFSWRDGTLVLHSLSLRPTNCTIFLDHITGRGAKVGTIAATVREVR